MAKMRYGQTDATTMGELLRECAERYGTKTAFRQKKDGIYQNVSFARFYEEAKALSRVLGTKFRAGDRVMILCENGYNWVLSFMALSLLSCVAVPVDTALSTAEITAVAKHAGARGVLYGFSQSKKRRAFAGLCAVCLNRVPMLIREGKKMSDVDGADRPATDAPAALFFTAGTTGVSKGVLLSHKNLLATLNYARGMMSLCSEDVFLSILPLSHVYECVCGFLLPFSLGAAVAFGEGLSHLLRNLREVHPTCIVTIPFLAEALYRKCWQRIEKAGREMRVRRVISLSDPVRPLAARRAMKERLLSRERAIFGGSLNRMIVLGGAMDASVQKGLRQLGVHALQGYGMTECAALAALNCDEYYCDGAAGLPFPGTMLDIYNEQPDGSGEIRYRGENVMLGYLGDPEHTAQALRGDWYYTGDIGRIDENGFLHVMGRRANCIETVSGQLICPEALERLLCQSPFIREAVVVGVFNEELRDSEPAALILPDTEYVAELFGEDFSDEDLEGAIDEWIAEINTGLAHYQQIGLYALRAEPFLRDATGRVRRAGLAAEFAKAMKNA